LPAAGDLPRAADHRQEFNERPETLSAGQGGKLVLEKGDDAKDLRRPLRTYEANCDATTSP